MTQKGNKCPLLNIHYDDVSSRLAAEALHNLFKDFFEPAEKMKHIPGADLPMF